MGKQEKTTPAAGIQPDGLPVGSAGTPGGSEAMKKETLLVPLDPNGTDGSVFLCVNGRNLLVKRGEPVQVAPAFAEVYRNAQKQQLAAMHTQQAAMAKAGHPLG